MKKQLLVTVLLLASGSLYAMSENARQRMGVFVPEELDAFERFTKGFKELTIDDVKEIRKIYPHIYQWATIDRKTALHHIIDNSQNKELLRFMLRDGADPYHVNISGENAFDCAKRYNPTMYEVLLAHDGMVHAPEGKAAMEDTSRFSGTSVLSFAAGALLMYLAKTTVDKYYPDKK